MWYRQELVLRDFWVQIRDMDGEGFFHGARRGGARPKIYLAGQGGTGKGSKSEEQGGALLRVLAD